MSDPGREVASRMAGAALALLDALDAPQLAAVAWPIDEEQERRRWFYTPTDHGGLAISAMTPAQQQLALRLVAAGLSTAGYVTVCTIMGLENVLDEVEVWSRTWGRARGRDPGLYYLRVFGQPGGTGGWSWRFGGHHVSINHSVLDGVVVGSTPLFLGADPASSPLLGPHELRPMSAAEDLGRDLVHALDDVQRGVAVLAAVAPIDHVSANRAQFGQGAGDLPLHLADVWRTPFEGDLADLVRQIQEQGERAAGLLPEHVEAVRLRTAPAGLPARLLRADQREILRALLDVYIGRIPDAMADRERAKYAGDAGLDELSFAWAGGLERGEGHYYRVQGARLLAEYDNSQRGANHVHSVWRDLESDFGGRLLDS